MTTRRKAFKSSYSIYKTPENTYKIVFSGGPEPPSYGYWNGQGAFLKTARFTTVGLAQVFRHNHLDIIDRKALGLRAFPDSGVYEYGRVKEYPLEPI